MIIDLGVALLCSALREKVIRELREIGGKSASILHVCLFDR